MRNRIAGSKTTPCWACARPRDRGTLGTFAAPLLGGLVVACCGACAKRRAVPESHATWFVDRVESCGLVEVPARLFDTDGSRSGMPVHVVVGVGYVPFDSWAARRAPREACFSATRMRVLGDAARAA